MEATTQKIPKLRFKKFNDNWKTYQFGEIFTMINTNSFSRAMLNYENGEVKNIHYGDIHTKFNSNFDITKELVPFLNDEVNINKIAENSFCKRGDLVIADASEDYKDVGKSIEIIETDNQKLVAGLHTYIARDLKKLTVVGFKGYLMQTRNVRLQIMELATGVSVLSISKGNINKLSLNIPSLPEQQKIASFLTSVDTKIQQLSQKKTLLEQYKKGVMQKIFNQEIRFKDKDGKEFPEWELKTLNDICEIAKSGGTPTSTKKEYYDGEIPFLAISDMTMQGKYLYSTSKHVSELGLKNSSSWIVPVNSVIYSMYASVGFVSINKIPIATSQAVLNLIIKNDANNEFVYYSLVNFQKEVAKFITTGTQGNLNAQTVKGFEIDFPCLKEQVLIANFLTALDVKIDLVNKQLEKTKEWKKGLLQQLFV